MRDVPDRELLETHCRGTPRERAAAARVLYLGDAEDLSSTGVDLLLEDDPGAFSVFGIDTLYRVAEADPSVLFERAAADFDEWAPALQQQVLLATRHLHTVVGDSDLSWTVRALDSPVERVRVAAWRALDAYGWSPRIRAGIELAAVGGDPSPIVRADAYRLLGAWGDADALSALRTAAAAEPDARARVAAADALFHNRSRTPETPVPDGFDIAWQWAAEHARFDAAARDVSAGRRAVATPAFEGVDG